MITSTTASRLMWIVYGIEVYVIITNRSMPFTRTFVKKRKKKEKKRKKRHLQEHLWNCNTYAIMKQDSKMAEQI